jgi:hypothetical protein
MEPRDRITRVGLMRNKEGFANACDLHFSSLQGIVIGPFRRRGSALVPGEQDRRALIVRAVYLI